MITIDHFKPSYVIIINHFLRNSTVAEFFEETGYIQLGREHPHALIMQTPRGIAIEEVSFILMKRAGQGTS